MENSKITQLYGITPKELKESIVSELKLELNYLSQSFKPTEPQEYLTRKEISKILKVSSVTLIEWDKKGVIQPYRLGNLIRYKRSEIEEALIRIDHKKYNDKDFVK